MAALQYVLEEGNREGWIESRSSSVLAAVAAIALVTFVVHELETEQPGRRPARLQEPHATPPAPGINFLHRARALLGGTYLFSLYCGAVMHYTALDIGRVFLVAGAPQVVLMPLVGKFAPKVRRRAAAPAFGIVVRGGEPAG